MLTQEAFLCPYAAGLSGCVPDLRLSAPRLGAQEYFGRNKVQYKKLDFQVLKTEHFDIYFYPSEREGIDISARLAERWHARLTRLLSHELRGRQPLILYASHPTSSRPTPSKVSSVKAPAA